MLHREYALSFEIVGGAVIAQSKPRDWHQEFVFSATSRLVCPQLDINFVIDNSATQSVQQIRLGARCAR